MSQLLITVEPTWYQSIANIRNYSEPDYEAKILKYANEIFSNYFVLKCKYSFTYKRDRSVTHKPDFLLISKNLKNWIIVEVELCNKPLYHTISQINCFSYPEFDTTSFVKYLINQEENSSMKVFESELYSLFENKAPELLVVYDDYCQNTFQKLRTQFSDLNICVVETYRTTEHPSEAYRISGDYPYEISGISKLKLFDNQHYEVLRPLLFKEYEENIDLDFYYYLKILKGIFIRDTDKLFLKLPFNPIPVDIPVQLQMDLNNTLILKRI